MRPLRPNVLYLNSHDTGRLIEPYGQPMPTPRLRQLAREGVVFRHAFCAAPTCSASRGALVTGEHPHQNGLIGLAHRGFRMRELGHHVIHTLRQAGYYSALVGEQHIVEDPRTIGYDHVETVRPLPRAALVAPVAARLLLEGLPEPFFLSVGFHETHRRFDVPGSEEAVRVARAPLNLPDAPETRADMAAFARSAADLDHGIEVVLDALDEAGIAERTLVIVTTDHGAPFPKAKATLNDRGCGVLLILRGPHPFRGGRVVDALVQQLDLYPTLCDLAGVPHPPWLAGRSLLPLLRGEVDAIRDEVFLSLTFHAAYDPQRAVRTRRYKYVRRFGDHLLPVLANVDDGPSKELLLRAGWGALERPREALYDLVLDPEEGRNLIAEPRYADVLADLRERLQRWMEETDDPLRLGPVEPPPGALLNLPDQRSAEEPTVTAGVPLPTAAGADGAMRTARHQPRSRGRPAV